MTVGETNWVLYNFLPFEYKGLKLYLEEMDLKGWKLESIYGNLLKFKKTELRAIKYSVDIVDKVSFVDGKDSEFMLEYRDYCTAANWNFVCEKDKIQIYCSESNSEIIDIQTDEKEKFKNISKASVKSVLPIFLLGGLLILNLFTLSSGNEDAVILAQDSLLLIIVVTLVAVIECFIDTLNYLIWYIKGKISVKNNQAVSYENLKVLKFKLISSRVVLYLGLLVLFLMIFSGEKIYAYAILMILISTVILLWLKKFISKLDITTRRKIFFNISGGIFTFLIFIFVFCFSIFSGILNSESNSTINKDNSLLVLKDFTNNDEAEIPFKNVNTGIFAKHLSYSEVEGENYLYYRLFESEYPWAIKYNLKVINKYLKEYSNELKELKTTLPKNVKVYNNGLYTPYYSEYVLVSQHKVLKIRNINENYNEEESLNIVYEKIFK